MRPTQLKKKKDRSPWDDDPVGVMALPGTYTVQLATLLGAALDFRGQPQSFDVVPLDLATFTAGNKALVFTFQKRASNLQRAVTAASRVLGELKNRLTFLRQAALDTPGTPLTLNPLLEELRLAALDIGLTLDGDGSLRKRDQPAPRSIRQRVGDALGNQLRVTSPPTQTQRDDVAYAESLFGPALERIRALANDVAGVESTLEHLGAPFTPGRLPGWPPK